MPAHRPDLRPFLAAVEKPARYIDHELNATRKSFDTAEVRCCLAFPDTYEVGISNLGLKLLYSILNDQPDTMCDRVYAPWPDMSAHLREHGIPLFALESGRSLRDFDVLGFTLQSELTYTNILEMLDLAGIPLHAEERGESDPIVIAGGPCACNPEPMSRFFDAVLIGEGEEAIVDLKNAVRSHSGRSERLQAIAEIPGYYVPQLHRPGQVVHARRYMEFDKASAHYRDQMIPWLQATHDRYAAEIMRGCSRGCRFCQAGFFYRPVRERDPETVLKEISAEVAAHGWEEVALVSLSSSDYTCILPVMREVLARTDNTMLSLPSLRVDTLNDDMVGLLCQIGQTGLTIAPEAGSQRLRDIINKNVTEEEILSGVEIALRNGWRLIKLYFMVGLPYETQDDIDAIVDLIEKIQQLTKRRLQLNITLSPFVPKPFTPFQWAAMDEHEVLFSKVMRIRNALARYRNLKIRYHNLNSSFLEATISRGDRAAGEMIETAWRHGARFDGWSEWFRKDAWEAAWEAIDPVAIIGERPLDQPLPWSHIDLGVDEAYLRSEREKAEAAATTEDCRRSGCTGCGLCKDGIAPKYTSAPVEFTPPRETELVRGQLSTYRIRYRRTGLLAYVSHLDLLRNMMRLFRASGLPIAHTQGFNPHPRISLSPPLSVGVEGWDEFVDIVTLTAVSPSEVKNRLHFPSGLELLAVEEWIPKEQRDHLYYVYEGVAIRPLEEWRERFAEAAEKFATAEVWTFERERKGVTKTVDMKALVPEMSWNDGELWLVKTLQGVSIFNILEFVFGVERKETGHCRIVRTQLAHERADIHPARIG